MSDQIFQTEVGKYVTDDNNLIVNSMTMNKHTLIGNSNPNASISVSDGIFTIKAQGLTSYNWSGFSLPIYVKKIYRGETYTLGFKYRIMEYPDSSFAFNIKNHGLNKILLFSDIGKDRPLLGDWMEFQKTFTVQEDFAFGEDYNYPFYIYLAKNGWIEFKEPILVRGSRTGPYKPSQFDDAYKITDEAKGLATDAQTRAIQIAQGLEATRTQVTQLAGSYAIQNLNSAGDIINGINVGANGNNRIVGKATHITGDTLIDNAVIKSAMIDKLKTANFEAGSVTTTILGAEAVTAEKVKFDAAFIQKLVSQQAFIDELFAKQATITRIQSIDFTANHIKGGVLSGLSGNSTFDLDAGQIRMQSSPTSWKTTWDPNGIAFRGPGNDVWGAMGGDSGGGVGIYMRGDHAFNLVVNHADRGKSYAYTPLRVKYGEGTILQFSPGGPGYNLLLLFNDIYRNLKLLHENKETKTMYSTTLIGPLK